MSEPNEERSAKAPSGISATDEHAAETSQDAMREPSRKRPGKKAITIGVVAAVVVVAIAGMWIWHEQPSFCNAICHNPMDPYVESYDSGDPGLGITAHAAAGESCLDCHTAELTTQVAEACAWVSDNYPVDQTGMLATGKQFATEEFCAKSGCHDMAEVVEKTWGFEGNDAKYNPHASHQDLALDCGDCHKVHETSTLVCNECHALTMPEGWEAPRA